MHIFRVKTDRKNVKCGRNDAKEFDKNCRVDNNITITFSPSQGWDISRRRFSVFCSVMSYPFQHFPSLTLPFK